MRLKKLFLHGFKSFADKVEINFEHGVTGVVGPNGCGKSNISDAVRWVLGEQSAKQLRGAKMEDVIFNGTQDRRRMGYCEVSLTFENEDRALPIDFAEVCVTRRVFRTGDSEYQINGSACRLKDIVDLFRDTGTGRDGYSIIGQGRVSEILSQKTEERREVFEEAAGIVKYKTRKQEAERRLENTSQNLDRVNDIVETLAERIEPLRLQSEDARKYIAWRDEQKGLELNAFLIRSERYRERIAEMNAAAETLKTELDENEARRAELSQKRDKYQEELTLGEEDAAVKRDALQALIAEVEASEGSAGVLRERIAGARREYERLEGEKASAEQGESGLEGRIELINEIIKQKQTDYDAKMEAFAGEEKALAEAESEISALEHDAEQAKERVIIAMNALGDVKTEQARLQALSQAIEIQTINLTAALHRDEDSEARLKDADALMREQLNNEKETLNGLKKDAQEIIDSTRRAGEEYENLGREAQQVASERQEVGSRLKLLKEMQRDYEGYAMSVKNVLMEADRRRMTSVHGVVANVVHASERIEKAVETALGAALQNVIVDTEEDAHELIDYLKENRLGRATFLPISAVRGRTLDGNERSVLRMPGCVGVASEMVSFDPKYTGIVQSLLGRTVIAENLTAGIPIHRAGRQQFRLVTLDGDVMNVGGSMTGGSTQSRMTSLLSREREITESTEKLTALTEKLTRFTERLKQLGDARGEMKQKRQEALDAVHQQEIAVTRAEAHLSRADAELREQSERVENIRGEIENLAQQKEKMALEIEELSQRKQTEEDSGGLMREEAARLTRLVNEKRPALSELQRKNADARVELTALEKDISARRADSERLTRQKGDTARMLKEATEALKALSATLSNDEDALKAQESSLALSRASLNSAREEFGKVDAMRLNTQELLKNANTELDSITRVNEELSERAHRGEMLRQRVETEFDNLNTRIFEDYNLTYEGAEEFRDPEFKLSEGEKRINVIKGEIKALGNVNVGAVDEYREVSARYEELSKQQEDLEKAKQDLLGIIDELTGKMEVQFKAQFEQLDVYFRQTFTELFGGGQARLSLEDPSHALTSGIEIEAQPPGKKLQLLSLLSGGERALTAIAILFAMLKLKPTPFCILDEIEAALDDANIDNFADYLKLYSEKTQFVVVTHRKGTMARCDSLYGVAMEEKGVSKLMSVKLGEAV